MTILFSNDQPGVYPESYYAATTPLLDPFPSLKGEHRTDVCIIGAGYSGLSAALHLRRRGYEVALVDAHRVGWGASGRNGGQVGTGHRIDQQKLTDLVGPEDARKLWQISEDAKALVSTLIEELGIECDYRKGIIHANHKARFADETKRYVEFMNTEYGYDDISFLDRDELRVILATRAYYEGTYDRGGRHLHPLRLALGLAKGCADAGVEIFERTEVTDIVEGDTPLIKTRRGEVKPKFVVLAANGYLGVLNRRTAKHVIPINNYMIATEPLSKAVANALIANDAAVSDSKFVINYYRLSDDGRLLFGGKESYGYRFPADIKGYVRKAMLGIYPQLGNVRIDYGWGGTLGITMSRMPHFQWLTSNMLTIGGYSGHGVMMAIMGGALAAEAIAGTAERFSVMERVPTPVVPGGYHARVPLLVLAMAYYSLRDWL